MQEQFVATQTCSDEQGSPHTFRYFLLTEEICAGSLVCESYGFKIHRAGGDTAEVHGVTLSRTRAEHLLTLLTRNAVSPTHLSDVILDCL